MIWGALAGGQLPSASARAFPAAAKKARCTQSQAMGWKGEAKMRPAPQRIQLRRSQGWRMPTNTVKVDRATRFGNPFLQSQYGRGRAIALFRAWIMGGGMPSFYATE